MLCNFRFSSESSNLDQRYWVIRLKGRLSASHIFQPMRLLLILSAPCDRLTRSNQSRPYANAYHWTLTRHGWGLRLEKKRIAFLGWLQGQMEGEAIATPSRIQWVIDSRLSVGASDRWPDGSVNFAISLFYQRNFISHFFNWYSRSRRGLTARTSWKYDVPICLSLYIYFRFVVPWIPSEVDNAVFRCIHASL